MLWLVKQNAIVGLFWELVEFTGNFKRKVILILRKAQMCFAQNEKSISPTTQQSVQADIYFITFSE